MSKNLDSGPSQSLFLALCFDVLRKQPAYQNKWMTADNWLKLIEANFVIPSNIKVNKNNLGRGLTNYFNTISFHSWMENSEGVYRASNNGTVAFISKSTNGLPKQPTTLEWRKLKESKISELRMTRSMKRKIDVVIELATTSGSKKPRQSCKGSSVSQPMLQEFRTSRSSQESWVQIS